MSIHDLINSEYTFYAHTPEGQEKNSIKQKETLEEHTKLCEKYYEILMQKKNLKTVFDRIICKLLNTEEEREYKLFYECLRGVIEFHDIGKINPIFQKEKMNHDLKLKYSLCGNSNHSFFSSYLYLDYFRGKLNTYSFSKEQNKKWKYIILLNAYVISRHHGELKEFDVFTQEFMEGGKAEEFTEYLAQYPEALYKGPIFYTLDEGKSSIYHVSKYQESCLKIYDKEQRIVTNLYIRFLYSLLTTCDYYATSEYCCGVNMEDYIENNDIDQLADYYEHTNLVTRIRTYEKEDYRNHKKEEKSINDLRTEIFLDAEYEWKKQKNRNLFYLEAPTGSGKSNAALNLSFKMLQAGQKKIWYIYPFNTLVEQNYHTFEKMFENNPEMLSKITVINSVTPIKKTDSDKEENIYRKSLLDRQFMNYSIVLTTHVNLFRTLFGKDQEEVFGFLQLVDSVIILDEIQSYKNEIWSEMITFFKIYAEILNSKIIIMSATLPNLDILCEEKNATVKLIQNREKYFSNSIFKDRVQISYELMDKQESLEELYDDICMYAKEEQKTMLEFMKKTTAYDFFYMAKEDMRIFDEIYLLTGDDNILERDKILKAIEDSENKKILLVATQVVEAGIDMDMDIGFKNISRLDSEEQFMGRINRSCKKTGKVYFFQLDDAKDIYKDDIRIADEFTLKEKKMRNILKTKRFEEYYHPVLEVLKSKNRILSATNLEEFFYDSVGKNNFSAIEKRMCLIEENQWNMSIFLARKIVFSNGSILDGWNCWNEYKKLLQNSEIDYSERQYRLSLVRSQMNYFIYEIKKNTNLCYSDRIGELYAIEDGEKYFVNGKLDKVLLQNEGMAFISL